MLFGDARMLLTLHTSVYYILNPPTMKIECQNVCSVSEDSRHFALAVSAHLKPILQQPENAGIKYLHIFTDGPTAKYKNKTMFFFHLLFRQVV